MNLEYFKKISTGLIPVGCKDQDTQKEIESRGAILDSTDEDYLWYRKARMLMSTDSVIGTILSELDDCPLECDGLTRVISLILSRAGIVHEVFAGKVQMEGSSRIVQPHLWIILSDNTMIDFRIRMWMGDQVEVPHGHFDPVSFQHMNYQGSPIEGWEKENSYALILATINQIDVTSFEKKLLHLSTEKTN